MPMTANGYAKLIEECGELQQVAGKRLAYFYTDEHPDGAGPLTTRIEAEMGDVLAAMRFVAEVNGLRWDNVLTRADMKHDLFNRWHDQRDNNEHAVDGRTAAVRSSLRAVIQKDGQP